MDITCDICGKPCRGQGTQGRGRNQRPATSAPTPRPTTPFIPNRHPGLVPHPICPHSPKPTEAHTSQTNPTGPATSTPRPTTPFIPNRHPGLVPHPICPHSPISARNPRIRHAARLPTDTPASHPHHSCAQNADHLAQNTPHSPNFTEVVCALGASIPNTVRSAQIHQSARNPRVHHAAQPPPDAPASYPHHSCAQNADHLAQNTPHSLNFTEVVCALGAHRTIGSTSKETQWMRIRSTPLRRTHTPPQVRTTLSAVDSLGVLSWASW